MMPTGIFWDQLPIGGHFQNGRQRNLKIQVFAYNFPSMTDRDMVLVTLPMFLSISNPIIYHRTLYHVSFIIKLKNLEFL